MLTSEEVIKLIDDLDSSEKEKVLGYVYAIYFTKEELLDTLGQKQLKNVPKAGTLIGVNYLGVERMTIGMTRSEVSEREQHINCM